MNNLIKNSIKKPLQLLVVTVLLLLPACGSIRHHHERGLKGIQQHVLLDEAKLVDVSLPIGVVAYDLSTPKEEEKQDQVIFYEVDFSLRMLTDFYQLEMERLGWKELALFESADEVMLVHEKPRKICVIYLRTGSLHQQVTIFIGPRGG
jgi:hypothetical protein